MNSIQPHEVYTTQETRSLLKISKGTIKRLLKKDIIKANKIGGQNRILGKELLRLISPAIERKTAYLYRNIKGKVKKSVKNWQIN